MQARACTCIQNGALVCRHSKKSAVREAIAQPRVASTCCWSDLHTLMHERGGRAHAARLHVLAGKLKSLAWALSYMLRNQVLTHALECARYCAHFFVFV